MNEERTTGIILRTRRLTETSLIVHWLTLDAGRVSTVAKGALRAKSPFRGKLDLFHEAELAFVRSRSSELHHLRELSLRRTNARLRESLLMLHQASYATALIEQTTEPDTPTPEIYELMIGFIAVLVASGASDQAMLAFELKLLAAHGLDPGASSMNLPSATRDLITQLLSADFATGSEAAFAAAELRSTAAHSGRQLLHHFDRVPAQRDQAFAFAGV